MGVFCVLSGLIVNEGLTLVSAKLVLVVLFVALANPIGSHALGSAAYNGKLKPVLTLERKKESK